MSELIHVTEHSLESIPAHWRQFAEMATEYRKRAKSTSTQLCYRNDFKLFSQWCVANQITFLPCSPEAITWYISVIANEGKKVSTIERRLAAIRYAHITAGFSTPTDSAAVKEAISGIKRNKKTRVEKKAAARVDHVIAMLEQCPQSISGIRDRALFAVCLAGGYRASEPLSIDIEDIEGVPEGYIALLRSAKNDANGKGKLKGIMNGKRVKCAEFLRLWLNELSEVGITTGPIFRPISKSGNIETNPDKYRLGYRSFYNLLKRYAAMAGLNPDVFGTHSLRRGFISESFEHGAAMDETLGVTGQASFDELLEYKEVNDLFKRNPGRLFL